MRTRFIHWIIIAALLLAGCTGPAAQPERPPLRFQYSLWEGDYTLLIAQEKGFFEKHGVRVEPILYPVFNKALPDLAARKIDGGLFPISDVLNAAMITPVRGVAVYSSGGPSYIMAQRSIESIADLKGKRVGALPGTYGEMVVRQMLQSGGLSFGDIELVMVDPENITERLSAGELEAGYVWVPLQQRATSAGHKIIYAQDAGSTYSPDLIVMSEALINERPEDVRAFLDAWFEALDYRKANMQECDEIIARLTGQTAQDVRPSGTVKFYNQAENRLLFDQAASRSASIFYIADVNLQFMTTIGLVTFPPELEKILDPSFLN